jgi:hypothetical protein
MKAKADQLAQLLKYFYSPSKPIDVEISLLDIILPLANLSLADANKGITQRGRVIRGKLGLY